MKKIMMIAAMMLMSIGAFAQNEVGQFTLKPMVGLNLATITNMDGKIKVGVAAGVEGEYGISENFGLTAGVLYSLQGTKSKDVKDLKINTGYINIPILANLYVTRGLALKAGIQPGFLVSAKEKYTTTESGISVDVDADIKSQCQKFEFAIPVGVSYEFSSFVLDARYSIPLTKMFKNNDEYSKTPHNTVFMISLGYKFAL